MCSCSTCTTFLTSASSRSTAQCKLTLFGGCPSIFWISVEHAHWPSCQNKSLFSTRCLINAAFLSFSFSGFSFDRDPQLYFDDTCVVPERLEGKTEKTTTLNINPRLAKMYGILYARKVGIFWDRLQPFDCSRYIMNSKSTSQWPSGRNVSPHCGHGGVMLTNTFLFLHSFPFFLFLFFSPLSCCCLFHLQVKSNRNPLSIVTDLPTSAVAPCSYGSSWSHYWMTQPMATS